MSQRDVVAELRSAQLQVPAALRERVRLIVAAAPPERRGLGSWRPFDSRRWLAVLVPVAAAAAVAVVVTRPSHHTAAPQPLLPAQRALSTQAATGLDNSVGSTPTPSTGAAAAKLAPLTPSSTRAQRYSASLTLTVANATAVSNTTKQALAVVTALGGYVVSAHVQTGLPTIVTPIAVPEGLQPAITVPVTTVPGTIAPGTSSGAAADLVLKVPKTKVRTAIARLSALGTITAEQVDIQDLQAGLATTDRTMQQLQRQLATLRAEPQTAAVGRQIAAITAHIQRLQQAAAATIRAARYATVDLHVATPVKVAPVRHGHGPLHGLGVAFRWIGIGAVYALALGLPALVLIWLGWLGVRAVRRRREAALLSRL